MATSKTSSLVFINDGSAVGDRRMNSGEYRTILAASAKYCKTDRKPRSTEGRETPTRSPNRSCVSDTEGSCSNGLTEHLKAVHSSFGDSHAEMKCMD